MFKPKLEEIKPIDASSFFMIHQKKPTSRCLDFWHFHPEFELVYVPRGKGSWYIDNKISHFENGDLMMLGPNIPHNTYYYGQKSKAGEQYVIQIKEEKILGMAEHFQEFGKIKHLLHDAKTGICIAHESKHLIGKLVAEMEELEPFPKLLKLFQILEELQNSKHRKSLDAGRILELSPANAQRIQKVFAIIKNEYHEQLTTGRMASELAMTESSFCRFFLKSTGKTFKTSLNEFRVQRACYLLLNSSLKINVIAVRAGFNSLPLFYRFFKSQVGTTPAAYRKNHFEDLRVP